MLTEFEKPSSFTSMGGTLYNQGQAEQWMNGEGNWFIGMMRRQNVKTVDENHQIYNALFPENLELKSESGKKCIGWNSWKKSR